jgi:aminopeptidase N
MKNALTLLILLIVNVFAVSAQESNKAAEIDVLRYSAEIEPDLTEKSVQGQVTIVFNVTRMGDKVEFDCGDLQIESVQSNGKQISFESKNGKVSISPGTTTENHSYEVTFKYHGSPSRGINFFPEQEEVYTVFSTSQWLVCKDQPDDKATLQLKVTIPSRLKAVGSGDIQKQTRIPDDKTIIEWSLSEPFPTYTYGFAIGPYNEFVDSGNLTLRYLSAAYTSTELEKIFGGTRNIIQFFEQRSGVSYKRKSYTQILGEGNVSQEMAGFTVIRLNYGKQVLGNSSDINLAAHELAHQWWGNSVTCVNWNHFWLNEGFAVFMSSAYKETKFGREEYLKDISTYKDAYQSVVNKGLDKPLTFPNWRNPSSDDRTLVYYKGAYVLHLLREQLGEKAFWEGVKQYTSTYSGKSVTAKDFRQVMEKVSGQDLGPFFSKWIE